jgi:radical SAM superfamily enzyme YgiQ (UPF0313 family)
VDQRTLGIVVKVAIAQFDGATTMRAPPLAAGLLAATLRAEPSLATSTEVYAARRDPDEVARTVANADVLGISLYTWNQRYSLEIARRARALSPGLRIIAGGPSVPRRVEASSAFLAQHPWLDAIVLGEGERAFVEIVRAIRDGGSVGGIAGVVVRRVRAGAHEVGAHEVGAHDVGMRDVGMHDVGMNDVGMNDVGMNDVGAPRGADLITLGPPRKRLAGDAFAAIGSPYLDGTFDALVARGEIAPIGAAVVETNRGCPFACTFCDWGQATQSKVNELPLERVERELAWLAERGVPYLYLVDANFGIRRRDEELTRTIGKLARTHASPRFVFFHLTKNATTKNLRTVEILREHGVATQVALSMQDFDADVLLAIKRDNIRPTDALDLRARCHAQDIPTHNELMLGLPAQTAASIRRSVSAAITPFPNDSFFLYPTRVLDNAELAEPAYRARFGIETRLVPTYPPDPAEDPFVLEHEELVVATDALPVADWCDAHAFGFLLAALWNQRVLQTTLHVATFALGIPVPTLVDALLAAPSPRLTAIRAELARFSAAILEARATTLAIDGWGTRRREPIDGVCARILEDADAFYAEVAAVAAGLVVANTPVDAAASAPVDAAASAPVDAAASAPVDAAASAPVDAAASVPVDAAASAPVDAAASVPVDAAASVPVDAAASAPVDAAASAPVDAAAILRDAARWDALQIPHDGARELDFSFDWLAYVAAMGACPMPVRAPIRVRSTTWPTAMIREGQLDGFLGLGWAKLPRGTIERV